VRVATLSRMVRLGKSAKVHLEANPAKILQQIQQTVLHQQADFDRTYAGIILELQKEGILIKNDNQLSELQREFVHRYFDERVRTQIAPLMIESIPVMPLLNDKAVYLACVLGNTENPMLQRYALISIPTKVLPRFVTLPSDGDTRDIILLEDIIRVSLPNLFGAFGFNRFLSYIIKVTRDAELEIDSAEVSTNIISELEKGLKNRKKGRATRFVFDRNIEASLLDYLILKRVKEETGIEVKIITGQEEANIIYETHIAENLNFERSYLYVDVGGGSTEVTLFSKNAIVFKESFNIGTIRLLHDKVTEEQWEHMKWYLKTHVKDYQPIEVIGSGGNINKVFSISKRKEGKPLPAELLRDYYKELSAATLAERMHRYQLREDRADVIVPALQIFICIMRWAGADEIYVPKIGLADGLIKMLYQEQKNN
ncbi:polyphosphate kinase, partial [Ostertagia ostertagi]